LKIGHYFWQIYGQKLAAILGATLYTGLPYMDMDISMDIHAKSVNMDMAMDGKFHIHGNPGITKGRL